MRIVDGPSKGKQGVIKHIYKYFVFLHSKETLENSGVIVVRSHGVQLVGGQRRDDRMTRKDLSNEF